MRTTLAAAVLLLTVGCTSEPGAVGGSTSAGAAAAQATVTAGVTAGVTAASVGTVVTAPALSPAAGTTGVVSSGVVSPGVVSSAPGATSPAPRPARTSSSMITTTPPGGGSVPSGGAPGTGAPAGTPAPGSATPGTTAPRRTTAAARPTRVPAANLTAPGPDNGPPCAVDPQYSDETPTGLRPDVLAAWVAVKKYAKNQGVALCLNDGKRSTAQQLALYADYVKQFGRAAADVYVLPPSKSAHVKGYAVDVQPAAAYQWLQTTRGARGWCRIYDNEPWHFEYSRGYQTAGCPARLPEPVG